ncbi:Hsp20/alpha crystallin family protein [Ectothiorhodospira variabilis]|uniref:Hsp20/alpha crystallin family protein n=1 Tax=Ectothiorhodospira variabilis TaxID=505694 RepID=UPI001EFBB578|nr:Hsp20/alpha crystallin family protein [Ectothiorhodospira variabilis]MCG5495763.1 Hsp20/alpha crystallin family protein [Ectothiorhodospira variabilis]MCG5498548.1 Hsp20/alpha crystallin family protein [Ectothiorhodospira variabilis]MCG5505210.1 Hsp20/alpha crystallin family protein [Ectothiorhodospira variabilis]MCG5508353.1 Hsp20/alpha crystallin family protein [Ectothiorhodospira variabilis]
MTRKPDDDQFAEGRERLDEISRRLNTLFGSDDGKSDVRSSVSIGGNLLGSLTGMLGQLGDLVDKAQESGGQAHRTGEFGDSSGQGARGVYGVSVKVGIGDHGKQDMQVDTFGNVRRNPEDGEVEIQPIREPLVDVFDEDDHVLVVAEVPGILEEDLKLELNGDILVLHAERGDKKYHKEILLPKALEAGGMTHGCNGGVAEIRINK